MDMVSEYCPPKLALIIKVELDEYELYLRELELILNKIEMSEEFVDKAKRYRRVYLGTELEHRIDMKNQEDEMKKKLSENQVIVFKRSKKKDQNYKIKDIRVM